MIPGNPGAGLPDQGIKSPVVILLVEDDSLFRQTVAKFLEKKGFVVREAENGLVAKKIFDLAEDKIDLVVSDIRMPEADGIQLLAHIRKNSRVPFIVMTGFSEVLESKSAYDLGADEFITKPFRANSLLELIHKCVSPESAI